MASPTAIVAYLALFTVIGVLFLFVNLVVGMLLRPADPHAEKLEIYECGEPAIGSSFVQFDLRFYVVALVFIVFDAEVAFLFPAVTVFGKQTQLADTNLTIVQGAEAAGEAATVTPAAAGLLRELGVASPAVNSAASLAEAESALAHDIKRFTWFVYGATLLFFIVLFVGFAYEWKTGAFDWVRAVTKQRSRPPPPAMSESTSPGGHPVLSG